MCPSTLEVVSLNIMPPHSKEAKTFMIVYIMSKCRMNEQQMNESLIAMVSHDADLHKFVIYSRTHAHLHTNPIPLV
jgi:hypothetical protein